MYASVRAHKISSKTDLRNFDKHGKRIGSENATFRDSVDDSMTHLNQHYKIKNGNLQRCDVSEVDLVKQYDDMVNETGAKASKLADHIGTEMILLASPEYFLDKNGKRDNAKIEAYVNRSLEYANHYYGGKVFGARLDLDETTPHLSLFICPHYEKTYKKRGGDEILRSGKIGLSHNKVIPRYDVLQTQYATFMNTLGLSRGLTKEEHKARNEAAKNYGPVVRKKLLDEAKQDVKSQVQKHYNKEAQYFRKVNNGIHKRAKFLGELEKKYHRSMDRVLSLLERIQNYYEANPAMMDERFPELSDWCLEIMKIKGEKVHVQEAQEKVQKAVEYAEKWEPVVEEEVRKMGM